MKTFTCVKKVLLTGVMAALAISGYAQYPKTVKLYPTADIQFRMNNTTQKGDAPSMEMRTGTANVQDWAFVGGMKFSIVLEENEKVTAATLRLTAAQSSKDVVIYPFVSTFGEVGGTTDTWSNYEAGILAAVAATPVVPAFRPNWGNSKKIFEWTPIAPPAAQRTIAEWQKDVDVTSYVVSKITGITNDIGILLGPSAATTATADPSIIFTKDVQLTDANYGTGMTDQYDYTTAAKNGTTVKRWQRIQDLLDVDDSTIDQLYPMLTLTIEEDNETGIDAATTGKTIIDKVYYDLAGRQVSSSAKGILLQKSVYDDGSVSYGKVYVK